MNPADLSISNNQPSLRAIPALTSSTAVGRESIAPRINTEPIYTQLKAALGSHFTEYKACLAQFVLGNLNQAELSWVLQPMLSGGVGDGAKITPATLVLHNTLVAAVYANTLRDPPPTEVAPWVVATDKPTATSRGSGATNTANDKVEERLKQEVMSLHARDRRRIKSVRPNARTVQDGFQEMLDYRHELAVKPSVQTQMQVDSAGPQSATGTGPTETLRATMETQRRYVQPLASETLEFPSLESISARIEPIAREEGLTGGVQQGQQQAIAELVEQATEVYLKEMISSMLKFARSNAPEGLGVQTSTFKSQLHKEQDDLERGSLQRNAAGLLPVEIEAQAQREPLDLEDMRLGIGLGNSYLSSNRFLEQSIMLKQYPQLDLNPPVNGLVNGSANAAVNGLPHNHDAMVIEDDNYGHFKGATNQDRMGLFGVLDECLLASG